MNTHEFKGKIAASFTSSHLKELCAKHIPGFDDNRFRIIAVRVFAGTEFIVTVYANDLKHSENTKLQVKKFKIESLSHAEFYNYVYGYNFTVFDEAIDPELMEVENK
jgi:hypothetical protein